MNQAQSQANDRLSTRDSLINLFLSGDVMLGRGIDQILPHPSDPFIPEAYLSDAREYVRLAEKASGSISTPVSFNYIWGDAIEEWKRLAPDVKLINLENTTSLNCRSALAQRASKSRREKIWNTVAMGR